ncbi:MAG: hypothetical protein KAU31_05970, partial [Spirochaetaceae bacterium]|nr:hypothetical protein [Spirochaetaceae bacterium]
MKSSVAGFVLLLTALFFSACATETGIGGSDIPQLSPSEMMEDLAFIHDKVTAVHPAFLDGQPAGFQEALGLVQAEASVPLTRIAFISALNGMLRLIDDAHTAVRFPDELLAPRLPLVWLASGLFAHQDITTGSEVPQIESGDQIIAIAGYPMDAVSHIVADTLIVTESRDDLRAAGLPLIFSEALLSNLGVPPSQPAVLVSVLRDGVAQEVSYVRYEANGRRAAYFAEAAVYSIPGYDDWSFPRIAGAVLAPQIRALSRDGIVYVRFDRCHLDDQYQEGLRRMAAAVK